MMTDDPLVTAERIVTDAYMDEIMSAKDYWGKPRYYDMQGRPIKFSQWNAMMKSRSMIVAKSYLPLGKEMIEVSTVLLSMNYNFGPGRPIIFETMIFVSQGLDGHPLDQYTMRYSTLREARRGHKLILRVVQRYHRRKPLIHNGGKP